MMVTGLYLCCKLLKLMGTHLTHSMRVVVGAGGFCGGCGCCGDFVAKKCAIGMLASMGRAKHEIPGPITLSGVGDQKVVCKDGVYSLKLPLCNGQDAIVSGLGVNKIMAKFPKYSLREAEKNFRKQCLKLGGENLVGKLPNIPWFIGGEIDNILYYNVGRKVC